MHRTVPPCILRHHTVPQYTDTSNSNPYCTAPVPQHIDRSNNVPPLYRPSLCLQVRTQFRKIFTQMGFEEMPTNNYVESSFWNFDALFQPQQHPARDAHDTFFLTSE